MFILLIYFVHLVIDGGFSEWTWSECSEECGEGLKEGQRQCNNPPPKNGGKECEGDFTKTKPCKLKECPGKIKQLLIITKHFYFKNVYLIILWLRRVN